MATISHLVRIKANTKNTFKALTTNEAIAKWFTETECYEWAPGSIASWFGSINMTISDLRDDELICLHVNKGGGWDNTDLRFAVEQESDRTIVRFDHSGWSDVSDHFRDCSMSWAYFLESLRKYLETGEGTPEEQAPACESE